MKTRACKHFGASLGSIRPFCGWKQSRALSRRCLRSLATCQTKHGWRCEGKPLSREDEMAVPPICKDSKSAHFEFNPSIFFTQRFRAHFPSPAERIASINQLNKTPPKVESGTSDVNCDRRHRALVCQRRGKRSRTLLGALPGRVFLKGQLHYRGTTAALGEKSKEQSSCACASSRGNHRQSKSKEGQV